MQSSPDKRQYDVRQEGGKPAGPFTGTQILQMAKSGLLKPCDSIAVSGTNSWQRVDTVNGLTPHLTRASPVHRAPREERQVEPVNDSKPELGTSERMLSGTCPNCGASDVYTICRACLRFNGFLGDGEAARCRCGVPVSTLLNCPHCRSPIPASEMSFDAERQRKYRSKLPRLGLFVKPPLIRPSIALVAVVVVGVVIALPLFFRFSGEGSPRRRQVTAFEQKLDQPLVTITGFAAGSVTFSPWALDGLKFTSVATWNGVQAIGGLSYTVMSGSTRIDSGIINIPGNYLRKNEPTSVSIWLPSGVDLGTLRIIIDVDG